MPATIVTELKASVDQAACKTFVWVHHRSNLWQSDETKGREKNLKSHFQSEGSYV